MTVSQAIAQRFNVQVSDLAPESWISIPCPLHKDENASAGLCFGLKLFNCFGCGRKINFNTLAVMLNIEGAFSNEETPLIAEVNALNNLIEDLTKPKPAKLKVQVKEYAEFLLSRKLKPETIEEFGGYYVSDVTHPDYGHLVIPYGKGKLNKRRVLEASGDSRFRHPKGQDKGLFTRNLSKFDTIILCEGLTDYLTLWQSGIRNIAATFGASVSKQQLYLLRGKTVFILFDRDFAGYEGSKQALNYLRELGSIPIVLEIPDTFGDAEDKIDINSAYCHSGEEFLQWVRESVKKYSVYDTDFINDTYLENKSTVKFIKTGIPSLQFATGLHALAGMPGVGKSSLISWLIDYFVDVEGQRVLGLSYELSKEQMYARQASIEDENIWSDIELDQSIISDLTRERLVRLSKNLRIERNWGINEIKAAAKNFDVFIIDYIQRMSFDGTDERAGIKSNARELSNLTKDGKIVIIVSSIPRAMYDKTGVNIFKETGDIEYICQSAYLMSRMTEKITQMTCIKNTRKEKKDFWIEIDYGHQLITECLKPEVRSMIQ